MNSWISTGKNQAISGIEIGQAIGIDKVKKLAESAGIDVNKARDLLAEYLPIAIDKAYSGRQAAGSRAGRCQEVGVLNNSPREK